MTRPLPPGLQLLGVLTAFTLICALIALALWLTGQPLLP